MNISDLCFICEEAVQYFKALKYEAIEIYLSEGHGRL